MQRSILAVVIAATLLFLTGCYGSVRRTIIIESKPSGALVWLNDNEVGRTPTEVPFTWYGTYSVRLEHEGYEPLISTGKIRAPFYQWLVLDLPFETIIPGTRHDTHYLYYTLKPAEPADPKELLNRAEAMRHEAKNPPLVLP